MINYKGLSTTILAAVITFLIVTFILSPAPQVKVSANDINITLLSVSTSGTIDRLVKNHKPLVKVTRGYSDKDVKCLAMNIYYEARDQSIYGQHAVAHVTMNRVNHKKWRDTVCGVVYQKRQFSWTIKGKNYRPKNRLAWKRARLIAIDTLSNPNAKDLSDGALYYHADYVTPKDWDFSQLAKLDQVGAHIFYKYK